MALLIKNINISKPATPATPKGADGAKEKSGDGDEPEESDAGNAAVDQVEVKRAEDQV